MRVLLKVISEGSQQAHWGPCREERRAKGGHRQHLQGDKDVKNTIAVKIAKTKLAHQATWKASSHGQAGPARGAQGHPGRDGEGPPC